MKKAKFTVIDALIVIAVICAAAVCAVKVFPSLMSGSESAEAEFTVLVSSADNGFSESMSVGDVISLSYKDKVDGVITAIESEPAQVMTFDSINGVYNYEDVPDKEDIKVTVRADVEVNDFTVMADDSTPVKVGVEMPIRGKGYVTSGYVIESEIIGE